MNEFLKTLLNIRSLRASLRELSFEQLEEAKAKFDSLYQEQLDEINKARELAEERKRKVSEFVSLLADAGINPHELLAEAEAVGTKAPRGPRMPREPKYQYEENGVDKTWTGQGRTPKAIADQLAEGFDLSDFLIK